MHKFLKMLSRKNIHTSAYLTASKYRRLPVQIKGELKLQKLLLSPGPLMGCNNAPYQQTFVNVTLTTVSYN